MRILIAVEGSRGDVHPMMALGRSLQQDGHRVRIVAPPDFEAPLERAGLEFVSLGLHVRSFLREMAPFIHRRGPSFFGKVAQYGRLTLAKQFEIVPAAAEGMDYLIAAGTLMAAASAAELRGIPFRYVAYTPALLPSTAHTPALIPAQFRSRLLNRLLWFALRRITRLAPGLDIDRERRRLGLPATDAFRSMLSPRPFVAVDRPLAPVPSDCRIPHDQIRCLHPMDDAPLPEKLEDFLSAGPPPIYVGFGSMTDADPEATTRDLLAVVDRLGVRAVISSGWADLGDGPLPEHVIAIGPVSHTQLFPRMAAVVHHGGAGTTHAAARAGVPQVIVPHLLDQFYFARRMQALGVAPPPLHRGALSVDALSQTLRATLDNELLAHRAVELGEALASLGPERFDSRLLERTR